MASSASATEVLNGGGGLRNFVDQRYQQHDNGVDNSADVSDGNEVAWRWSTPPAPTRPGGTDDKAGTRPTRPSRTRPARTFVPPTKARSSPTGFGPGFITTAEPAEKE